MSYKCLCCERQDSGHRYACGSCVNKMRRWLREIETYAAMLPHMLHPMRGNSARRAPGFGSQPPLRLDAIVALDPRSAPYAMGRTPYIKGHREEVWDPETDDGTPTRSILSALHSLARWIREEQEVPEPSANPTITREVGYLLGAIDWCSQHQWVDELSDQIKQLHSDYRALAKDTPPGPLAECFEVTCDGKVFWIADIADRQHPEHKLDAAKCVKCGRIYSGVDLVRLRVGKQAS